MESKRLETAVENMLSVLNEIQTELNEYDEKQSKWYDHQLEQFYSGLMSKEEFRQNVFNEFQNTNRMLEVCHIVSMVASLPKRYAAFQDLSNKVDGIIKGAIERVPDGWYRFDVAYDKEPCAVPQHTAVFAPNEEVAKEFVMKVYDTERFPVNIVSIEKA